VSRQRRTRVTAESPTGLEAAQHQADNNFVQYRAYPDPSQGSQPRPLRVERVGSIVVSQIAAGATPALAHMPRRTGILPKSRPPPRHLRLVESDRVRKPKTVARRSACGAMPPRSREGTNVPCSNKKAAAREV